MSNEHPLKTLMRAYVGCKYGSAQAGIIAAAINLMLSLPKADVLEQKRISHDHPPQ